MGRPRFDAQSTVSAVPSSMQKPDDGVITVSPLASVCITRRPHTHKPTEMPAPPYARIQLGAATRWPSDIDVAIIQMPISGPIALLRAREHIQHKSTVHY